jgi:hypothetical protein
MRPKRPLTGLISVQNKTFYASDPRELALAIKPGRRRVPTVASANGSANLPQFFFVAQRSAATLAHVQISGLSVM